MDLDVPLDDGLFRPLEVAAPVRGRALHTRRREAFEQRSLPMAGVFSMNMEFDVKYAVVPLSLAQELLHYDQEAGALELQLVPGADKDEVAARVRALAGEGYLVRTRFQKNEIMYRTNANEKWFTYLVLLFIGLIGAFNIIASLTMLMIEKQRDVRTLLCLGTTPAFVRRIFFTEGLLITGMGLFLGLVIGVGICLLQQRFGFVSLSQSVVGSYPVRVSAGDLVLVVCGVLGIGVLATWVPVRRAQSAWASGLNTPTSAQ
jgi:lipoprotein-releasing system permease protein